MSWTSDFMGVLVHKDKPIAPRFRLIIGTAAINGSKHMGLWEQSYAKVLEISSHPYCSSMFPTKAYHASGSWDTGHPYQYMVGLTADIKMGAQTVTPRTWTYQGATLTVGVTKEAAEAVLQMCPGVLTRLECSLESPGSSTSTQTEWNTIHIGQFRNMRWNGQSYTVEISCALEATKYKFTDDEGWGVITGDMYRWFAGMGTEATVSSIAGASPTPITTGTEWTKGAYGRWGYSYKKENAWGGDTYRHGDKTVGGSPVTFQNFLIATPSSGDPCSVQYQSYDDAGGYMRLTSCIIGDTTDGIPGFGAAITPATLTTVCLLHGSPVTEIVNTLYVQGYHPEMVCGLFGEDVGSMYSEPLNMTDLTIKRGLFDTMFTDLVGASDTTCFMHMATAPSDDGYGLIKQLAGKWGVFPRFKMGGYSVGVVVDGPRENEQVAAGLSSAHIDDIIRWDDIQGAEISQRGPESQGTYREVGFTASDADVPSGPFLFTAGAIGGAGGDWPILSKITVNTTDTARGYVDNGLNFAKFFKAGQHLFFNWFVYPRTEATLRLRGLRFAYLSPGDYVHIALPTSRESAAGARGPGEAWGPSVDVAGVGHVLSSLRAEAGEEVVLDELGSAHRPWFVTSVHVDWVGGLVTLKLSRHSYGHQKSTFSSKLEYVDPLSADMGMPIGDIHE